MKLTPYEQKMLRKALEKMNFPSLFDPPQPAKPAKVSRRYMLDVDVSASKADHMRMEHNFAQHALAVNLVANDIDPQGYVRVCVHNENNKFIHINTDAKARVEDCTLAKAFNTLPFDLAATLIAVLTQNEPGMLTHPGVLGWFQAQQDEIERRLNNHHS